MKVTTKGAAITHVQRRKIAVWMREEDASSFRVREPKLDRPKRMSVCVAQVSVWVRIPATPKVIGEWNGTRLKFGA